jgi:hypothetical protein
MTAPDEIASSSHPHKQHAVYPAHPGPRTPGTTRHRRHDVSPVLSRGPSGAEVMKLKKPSVAETKDGGSIGSGGGGGGGSEVASGSGSTALNEVPDEDAEAGDWAGKITLKEQERGTLEK